MYDRCVENNKINLVREIYESLVQNEKDTYQFCRQTELGTVEPNSNVKNTALLHNLRILH